MSACSRGQAEGSITHPKSVCGGVWCVLLNAQAEAKATHTTVQGTSSHLRVEGCVRVLELGDDLPDIHAENLGFCGLLHTEHNGQLAQPGLAGSLMLCRPDNAVQGPACQAKQGRL